MEFQVKTVGGIESCFVSLPLSLIQALQLTNGGFLPAILALELRSRTGDCWHVAWSGSASKSPAIEVAQQFAECISLQDGSVVQVKVVANLPEATFVTIEPATADDWEVLELNSELAEMVILKQVGIVHEGMRFPLWLHGHTIVEFLVVSTSPVGSIVRFVPGTEVSVAPKRRKKLAEPYGAPKEASVEEKLTSKALLRVQVPQTKQVQRFEVKGFEIGVVVTSAVFIHPETAEDLVFDNLQSVFIYPRSTVSERMQNRNHKNLKQTSSSANEIQDTNRHLCVHLLLSKSVAKGHIMLPESVCLYLSVTPHSWVYVKKCKAVPQKDIPSFSLSPCQFKVVGKDKPVENSGVDTYEFDKTIKRKNIPMKNNLILTTNKLDWTLHEEVFHALCRIAKSENEEDVDSENSNRKRNKSLIHAWILGQLQAIASQTGNKDTRSIILGKKSLLHFEVMGPKSEINGTNSRNSPIDVLYILNANYEKSSLGVHESFEISMKEENMSTCNLEKLGLMLGKLDLGEPIFLNSVKARPTFRSFSATLSSLSWMEAASLDVINRLKVLLSPTYGKLRCSLNLPLPGHVLIYGPPGSGKTCLATAVGKYFEEHKEVLAHIISISCPKLSIEKTQTIRQALAGYISEALDQSPSLVIFDDLDCIVSSSSESEGPQSSNSASTFTKFLSSIMDEFGDKWQSSCGVGPIAFVASVQSLSNVPQSLCSSGRFDFHVELPAPAVSERAAMLKHEIHKRSLQCPDDIMSEIASKCDGYDAYDLEILVDRAIHAAISRFLPSSIAKEQKKPVLSKEDFLCAMHDFVPVAMRGITKSAPEGGRSGWEDVGGLLDIRNTIQEMIELPSKFPNVFVNAPLRLRSNVLLYGPPGCGKTHIVGAAAAACSLRFISVKGPELLNKYIGASEQAVRDIFRKAAAAAPCLLFFDEFDSIAPKRGHDNTGVTDRVVNQFLTELDGVESLTGVFVFAATSRPDLLDAALLRPGRLDRLLFCDFPSWHERLDILTILSKKLPLASDVKLEAVASMTDGFSGADLQALLSDAQLGSVHELLESKDDDKPGLMPVINDALLRSVASRARPSVSEAEKKRLYYIYNQFLDSKKSVAAQSRDVKGKHKSTGEVQYCLFLTWLHSTTPPSPPLPDKEMFNMDWGLRQESACSAVRSKVDNEAFELPLREISEVPGDCVKEDLNMSVIITTSLGDITVDLHTDRCPIKYFNGCLFHTVQKDFTAQTGDPTGKGTGGDSIYKFLYGDQARFFGDEIHPDLKHSRLGTVAMASAGENLNASQFYITLRGDLDYLDGKHTVFGQVEEGFDVLTRINEAYVDDKGRPYKNIRIKHTYIIDDPFDDPPQLAELIPDRSPEGKPSVEEEDVRLEDDWVPMDEKMNPAELEESIREKEAHTHAVLLETMGDIPDAEIKPPENVLFVCKLNPVTQDEDLDTIFSRFGNVLSAEIIRDYKTGDSLCYAFIEFESKESCEQAYFKMDNALIDDRRIHVDFSQSVAKLWSSYRRAGRSQNGKEQGCFKCGELGHVAKDCGEKSNARGQSLKYILKDENRQHGGNVQSYEMVFDDDNLEGTKTKRTVRPEHELQDEERKPNKDFRVPEHRQHKGHEWRDSASDRGKQSDRSWRYREEESGEEPKKVDQRGSMTKYEHQKREYDIDQDDGRRKRGHEDRYRKYKEDKGRTEDKEDERKAVYEDRSRKNREEKGRTDDRENKKKAGYEDRNRKSWEEKGRIEDREGEKKVEYEDRNRKNREEKGRYEDEDEKKAGYRKYRDEKGRTEDREDEKKAAYEDRNRKYREEKGRREDTENDGRRETGGSYTRDEKGHRKRSMDDKDHHSKHGNENEKRSRKHDDAPFRRDDRDHIKRTDNEDGYHRRHERDERRREDHDRSRRK
ncbi:hypothetical protein H6P81_019627 [Aristolochia fimbriata]|uniref:Peroxisomal ATPase PEX1 n=1 Tax=Aristolochia fimbriata TaxID=158543 RepID=A0AAV7DSB9_ARIFI|nr:hypothetical protein H6P81_019627 [Aristolochia fimbriata]